MTSLMHTASAHAHHNRGFTDIAYGFARYFALCFDVAHQRRQLRGMDARQLKDIGLTPMDADREIRRGFFDIPVDQFRRL